MSKLTEWADEMLYGALSEANVAKIKSDFAERFEGFDIVTLTQIGTTGQLHMSVQFAVPEDETLFRLRYA